jgi:hypothetical protein
MRWEAGDIHARTYWTDGVWAGLIAGAVFLMLEMFMVWAFQGQSPWGPPRMMAAMIMGEDVLPPPATFSFGIVMVAMMIHFALSIVYGLLGAWIVHRFDLGWALVIGAVYGWAIYVVNFLMIAPVMFPWFGMARGWISIFAHVVFGAVLTGSYVALRRRHVSATTT